MRQTITVRQRYISIRIGAGDIFIVKNPAVNSPVIRQRVHQLR